MKKTICGLALTGLLSFGAQATVIDFDEGAVGLPGSGSISVDGLDFSPELANVTQTDDSDGFLTGTDTFFEMGGTIAVDWELGTTQVPGSGLGTEYEIFIQYSLTGSATGQASPIGGSDLLIDVQFDPTLSMGTLFIDTTVDGVLTGGAATLGTFDMGSGFCAVFADVNAATSLLSVDTGSCDIDFDFMATAGYFSHNGTDLASLPAVGFNFDVTVQSFDGLYFDYAAQEAAVGDGDILVQDFLIEHDGNLTFVVPEPSSVAIVGLGLMLLGAGRRFKRS